MARRHPDSARLERDKGSSESPLVLPFRPLVVYVSTMNSFYFHLVVRSSTLIRESVLLAISLEAQPIGFGKKPFAVLPDVLAVAVPNGEEYVGAKTAREANDRHWHGCIQRKVGIREAQIERIK